MIWIIIFALCIAVFAYTTMPFYLNSPFSDDREAPKSNEVAAYRSELKNIEKELASENSDSTILTTQKLVMEKRLVSSATHLPNFSSKLKKGWMVGTFAILIAGTFGLYALIGSPNLTNSKMLKPATLSAPQALSQNTPDTQHENNASMNDLVAGLEKKLQAGDQNPQQWVLYARSLMTLNRFEDAFAAYEKTLSLTDNNPDVAAELESARAYAAQQNSSESLQPAKSAQPGPSQEDMEAASQMSPDDRASMIQGMVDGLSEKLAENPDDPNGWVRLLRARKVLGQTKEAQNEIIALKNHFTQNPETVSEILRQSGWNK